MATYQLFWGIYLQWTKQFENDTEARAEALRVYADETGWTLIRHHVVEKR